MRVRYDPDSQAALSALLEQYPHEGPEVFCDNLRYNLLDGLERYLWEPETLAYVLAYNSINRRYADHTRR